MTVCIYGCWWWLLLSWTRFEMGQEMGVGPWFIFLFSGVGVSLSVGPKRAKNQHDQPRKPTLSMKFHMAYCHWTISISKISLFPSSIDSPSHSSMTKPHSDPKPHPQNHISERRIERTENGNHHGHRDRPRLLLIVRRSQRLLFLFLKDSKPRFRIREGPAAAEEPAYASQSLRRKVYLVTSSISV